VSDIQTATDYYRDEVDELVAGRFIDAVEAALARIGKHSQIGTLRFAYELAIPDLRAWNIAGFPYVVFYLDRDDHVDVWRLLHAKRDIPATLQDEPA
jgi:toxin ParE1/3/4